MVNFQRQVLANGLTVIVHEDFSTPLVAINVLYKVGSKDEQSNKTGITHLFEHLMFGGTHEVPDFDEPIQMAGGENNAFTNADITNFYDVLPAENIEVGLWLEANRMERLKLTKKTLDTQKKVVIEEFKETCLNEPYGDVWHHLSDLSYQMHPYKWPTIGADISHIEAIQLEDTHEFYSRNYGPHNAILVLSGNVKNEVGFELAQKWFGHIPGSAPAKLKLGPIEKLNSKIHKTVTGEVPSRAIYLAFKMSSRLERDFYVVDLISDILSSGRSSRFYQRLIKDQQLFSFIDAYISGTTDPGLFIIDGRLMEGVTMEEARTAIWKELTDISTILMSERELEKIKNKAESNLVFSESSALNKSMSLAYFEYLENADLINKEVEIYQSITAEEIKKVAAELLDPNAHVELFYLPIGQNPA
ncbi:MAG: pitrilysin family protein [Saprospiraceae bacterium]|nr:pitrilysin family protein [Saprospiraceae bacterium]